MPIYEYQCRSCGHELEVLQKVSDPPLTDCPDCKQASLEKKISAAGFRLKGSGWYETDFKKGSEKKRNLAEGGEKPGSASKSKNSSAKPTGKAASGA